jgi:hypothetical protein
LFTKEIKIGTLPNTDGSVNKLVTIFAFLLLLSRELIVSGAPGYAHLPASKFLYRELFITSAEALYRETAPGGFDSNPAP